MSETEQTGLMRMNVSRQALEVAGGLRARFGAMPKGKRTMWMAGALMLVAVALGWTWWSSRPDYKVLFSGLDGKDVQQVSQELAAAGIAFQASADGSSIQVPAEVLDKARMEVAAKGMPQTGRMGFELFDKPNWVGSEFDERVNYQRALEGELEHTVETLEVVKSARVHLVLPEANMFGAERKSAKASVVLRLRRASVDAQQAESIRGLVAGAVENLSIENVTLVDADGRVNLSERGRFAGDGDEEAQLQARLMNVLEPVAGPGNVKATVNVSYDMASEEKTDEVYDPAHSAVLSVQKSEQTTGGTHTAQGVPGTASNTPAAAPAGAVQGSAQAAAPGLPPLLQGSTLPVFPSAGGTGQSVKEESGTYAVSKHTTHTETGPGRVRRVSAAVVVNDRMVMEGAGKDGHATWKTRSAEEMHRMEMLAQAAVGFDEKRGDSVVFENVSFTTNAPEPKPAAMEKVMEQTRLLANLQPGLARTAMVGLVGVMLVWLVLRPMAKQMVATLREPAALTAGAQGSGQAGIDSGIRMSRLSASGGADGAGALTGVAQVNVLEQLSGHIRREPASTTRLLKTWISAGGEEN